MIWFGIGLIITIIVTIYKQNNEDDAFIIFHEGILITIIGSLILSMVVGSIFSASTTPKERIINTTELIALKDNQSVSGSFFLGCGTVDEEQYYFYIENTDKGMKTSKIETENVYIRYSDETPKIITYNKEFNKNWYNIFGFPMWDKYSIIYIPKGSVTNEFDIDLE